MSKQIMDLPGKTILFGVTGGIAAYKAVNVVSHLRKRGAEVCVVMTEAAEEFVTPLTFRTISANQVHTDMFDEPHHYNPRHISLAEKGDLLAVVPATANIIAKAANGIADDFLSTLMLAFPKRKVFAPAMNHHMWCNPVTQDNVSRLRERGDIIVEPDEGRLASGAVGKGRMPAPGALADEIASAFFSDSALCDWRVTVTAGPTREHFDPVRYLSNPSSGKMGFALAQAARERGASVHLISGPTQQRPPRGIETTRVVSAHQMRDACLQSWQDTDILLMAAAVCDYAPQQSAKDKLSKREADEEHPLGKVLRTPDILTELAEQKGNRFVLGFSAETDRDAGCEKAKRKLQEKNLDMIALNFVDGDVGFASDDNHCILITGQRHEELPRMHKLPLARLIVGRIVSEICGVSSTSRGC